MKILAIAEISKCDVWYFEDLEELDIDWFDTIKTREEQFSFGKTFRLLKKMFRKEYDLIFMGRIAEHRNHSFLVKFFSMAWRAIKYPNSFAPYFVLWLLGDTRLIGLDNGDLPMIRKENHAILKKCHLYFKRELPQNLANAFVFTDKGFSKRDNIAKFILSFDGYNKVFPIAYGVQNLHLFEEIRVEKKYDVFFSGSVAMTSSARHKGVKQLEALKAQGLRVKILIDTPLPRDEFLRECAASYLVWSPEGMGWYSLRDYESLLVGSVPVINYPTIFRFKELEEGKHAFYYGQEGDHLQTVIKNALKDKQRLIDMARVGREFVLEQHNLPALGRYILAKSLE